MELTLDGLKKAGYTEEQAKAIMEAHKAVIDGNFVPKARFDEVNNASKQHESTIAERDKQIAALKKFEGTNEELKAKVAELQSENTKKDAEHKEALATYRIQIALKAHAEAETIDPEVYLSMLDMTKIQVDEDGKIFGLEAQDSGLREKKAYIFKPKEGGDAGSTGNAQKQAEGTQGTASSLGMFFVGSKPPEGTTTQAAPKMTDQERFGHELAKARTKDAEVAKKASDQYFNGVR